MQTFRPNRLFRFDGRYIWSNKYPRISRSCRCTCDHTKIGEFFRFYQLLARVCTCVSVYQGVLSRFCALSKSTSPRRLSRGFEDPCERGKETKGKGGGVEGGHRGWKMLTFLLTADFSVIFNYSLACFYVSVPLSCRVPMEKLDFARSKKAYRAQTTFVASDSPTLSIRFRSAFCFLRWFTFFHFF